MRRLAAACLIALLAGSGCLFHQGRFDPLQRGPAFDEAHKRFNRMIRWGQYERASLYVAEDHREDFLREWKTLRGMHFTDWEARVVDLDGPMRSAYVEVVFRVYGASLEEKVFGMVQEWEKSEDEDGWRVRPQLAELRAAVGSP